MDLFEYKKSNNQPYQPDSFFLISDKLSFTYSEFEKEVNRAAAYLSGKGINKNDRVILVSTNNVHFAVSVFALWEIGAVPVPLNIRLIKKELKTLIDFCVSKFVIADISLNLKLDYEGIVLLHSPFDYTSKEEIPISKNSTDINETAVIIFTSGSTGKPKGVMLTFKNLIANWRIGNQILQQTNSDKWLCSLPVYHIGGFSILTRAFLSGASIILPDSLQTEDLCHAINNFKPTLASFVSTQMKRLIDQYCKPNKELKKVLLGGGFIDADLCKEALTKDWKIIKVYGSSETSSFVAALSTEDAQRKINSSGKVLPPNEIKIIDDRENFSRANTIGEIAVKSEAVMQGYLKNEEATKLKDNFYLTGDIGYIDEEGFLFVETRRDDIIVSGGENINPIEVEIEIKNHPKVKEVSVFATSDPEWGQIVIAAIVTKDNIKISIKEIKGFLKNKIAGYKIPRKIFVLNEFPRTELGKVEKNKIIERLKN
jgi:o-succinylbenzoate---CoA ligase